MNCIASASSHSGLEKDGVKEQRSTEKKQVSEKWGNLLWKIQKESSVK